MNVATVITSFRKLNLIQLDERFNIFATRLYLKKFIT